MLSAVPRPTEARKIHLRNVLDGEMSAADTEADDVFVSEQTPPVRAVGWFPWLRGPKTETAAPAVQLAEPPDPRPEVRGEDLRGWLEHALNELTGGSAQRAFRYFEGQAGLEDLISVGQPLREGPIGLNIEGVQVINDMPRKVGLLNLGGIVQPELEIVVRNCAADRVSLAESKLRDVYVKDLSCIKHPGVIFYANNAIISGHLSVVGSDLPTSFSAFEPVTTNYPRRLENCFVRIDATNLMCAEFTIWNVALNGPHFLQWLEKANSDSFKRLYRMCASGLLLHRAKLKRVLAYHCQFHAPVTLRFATVEDQVKFEACYFQGYKLPLKSFAKRDIRDEFDSDDFRPLNGLVLDASRARLGRELVFRDIDAHLRKDKPLTAPRSSGWMNWSHSSTSTLNDDTTLWAKAGGKRWSRGDEPPMRFRLNGFSYDNIAVGHLLPAPRETPGMVQADPNAGQDPEGTRSLTPAPKESPKTKPGERAAERISWLYCQLEADLCEEFMAQPWTQGGRAFLTAGNRSQANRLFQERESLWHRSLRYRRSERLRAFGLYAWHFAVSSLPGYGYRMWAPFVVGIAVWLIGWVVFAAAFSDGFMMQNPDATNEMRTGSSARTFNQQAPSRGAAPLQPTGLTSGVDQGPIADTPSDGTPDATEPDPRAVYASPYPLMYSLDLLVPIVEFGQSNYWIPGENVEQQARSGALKWTADERQSHLNKLWIWYWVHIALGWYLSTVIVTSLAGLFEREH